MIKEFQFYLDTGLAKESKPDFIEAEALLGKAGGRLKFIRLIKIDMTTSPYVFEEIYECAREAAQSLMSLKGYKPYSHEALVSFLNEFFGFRGEDIASFNRYRILRNKTVYKGEKISTTTCQEALDFLTEFFPKLEKEFNNLHGGKI